MGFFRAHLARPIFRCTATIFMSFCAALVWGSFFSKLPLRGCFYDAEIYSKMKFFSIFEWFCCKIGHVSNTKATNLHYRKCIFLRFLAKTDPFSQGSICEFPVTPTSYRLVPNLARRDLFKNAKIGPRGGSPRKK